MPTLAIIGGQWGDEGKGRIADLLAEKANFFVRFSGGDNAGHTVINPYGEFRLHLIPSGIFNQEVTCIISNGVAVNPRRLIQEIDDLETKGVSTRKLIISSRAHLIMPYHIILDEVEENLRGNKPLGTTLRGVGPAFADKIARLGIRIGELLNKDNFRERLRFILSYKNDILCKVYGLEPLSLEQIYREYISYGERLGPFIGNAEAILGKAIDKGNLVVFEGAQGTLLDPDFGTYPYTTSSSPLIGGASLGSGIPPSKLNYSLGVFKAYCTRVGTGPMPTEIQEGIGQVIREKASEYGTTTGRPRRCGWFDSVAARFSCMLNDFNSLAITRLDVLEGFTSLKICTGYLLDGHTIDGFPANTSDLERCQPVYEEMEGWAESIREIRNYRNLPRAARKYITRIEELTSRPVSLICVGPSREETIWRHTIPLISPRYSS